MTIAHVYTVNISKYTKSQYLKKERRHRTVHNVTTRTSDSCLMQCYVSAINHCIIIILILTLSSCIVT